MSLSKVHATRAPNAPAAPATAGAEAAPGACWNQSGVYGSSRCPQLSEFVHCRNCPVYAAAGAQLLERELPPGYQREWAAHFAAEKKLRDARQNSAILFRIQNEWLALPTQAFQEVAERRLIHSLPHRRQGVVLGLVNVRGELLIAVSLGHVLAQAPAVPPDVLRREYHRLLVSSWEGDRFAFPVAEVQGPQRYPLEELKALPATLARSQPTYIQGLLSWQQRAVGLLEPRSLFAALNRSLA